MSVQNNPMKNQKTGRERMKIAAIILVIALILSMILGVTTRFFNTFGENIAKNRMEELGVDMPDQPEDETDERLR